MTTPPALASPPPADHPSINDTSATPRTGRIVGGVTLILLGTPVAAFFTIGTLFMAGAVQRHDPSVSWVDVGLGLQLALGGAALFALGVMRLSGRRQLAMAMPPPLPLFSGARARREPGP